ncbi:MAG: hypothetical protein ACRDPR_06355 [Nocardioidaceae bacterium]
MDRAEAARVMGMKLTEVVEVEETADGHVVTTHDGVRTVFPAPVPAVAAPEVPASEPVREQEPAGGEVPDGSAKDVLAWVGDDSDRALQALVREQEKDAPRKVLVRDLEKLLG